MNGATMMDDGQGADAYFYEPRLGHGLPADPFKAVVCPRPIGWISSRGPDGTPNLAPYSFFNAVNDAPPMVSFASDGWKNSVSNIKDTGAFAVNFVTRQLAAQMNLTSIFYPRGVDEFEAAGIESRPCRIIDVPCVAASPAVLECRLVQIVELKDMDGTPTQYKLTIGQVVGVHLSRAFLNEGLFDTAAAEPVMRAGYRGNYVQAESSMFFAMKRPAGS